MCAVPTELTRFVVLWLTSTVLVGCGTETLGNDEELGGPVELRRITEFVSANGLPFTSAQSIGPCTFVFGIKGARLLKRVQLGAQGIVTSTIIPTGSVIPSAFSLVGEDELLLQSSRDGKFALLNLRTQSVSEFTPPPHPWGGNSSGNAVLIADEVLAFARFGAQSKPRPPNASTAPIVAGVNTDGRHVFSVGIADSVGRHLPSFFSAATVGRFNDSILVIRHFDASISTASIGDVMSDDARLAWRPLPRRLPYQEYREEIWSPSWIQQGGELAQVFAVPEIEAARVGSDGTLYLLRNTEARWVTARNRFLKTQGMWDVVRRRMEIISSDGTLRYSIRVPPTTRFLEVDREQSRVLSVDSGVVTVRTLGTRNPTDCLGANVPIRVTVP
jgi:hypothetical protein